MNTPLNRLWYLLGVLTLPSAVIADDLFSIGENPEGKTSSPPWQLEQYPVGTNTERALPPDIIFNLWVQDETFFKPTEEDRIEVQKVLKKDIKTQKLENAVPPISFASGKENIPEGYVEKLRQLLEKMKNRDNLRVHFVGHSDTDKLGPGLTAKYGSNIGLSRARAETTAEFFQQALDLSPDSVSYDGVGPSQPIASNDTAAGKARNRRVEIQVWYDEISEKAVDEEVVIEGEKLNRVKVCRRETVCKLSYREGTARRARLKNLVTPLRFQEGEADLPDEFLRQISEVLGNLNDNNNVVVRFVGHTDNLPMADRQARIYGTHENLSKARARIVALSVADKLGLESNEIGVTGKGLSFPVASNDTDKGRALNRRIEVEFWYDDPFEQFSAEPQACPESDVAETVTLTHDPLVPIRPIRFQDGKPVIPPGYADRLIKSMEEISDKSNVRLRFTGYTDNKVMERRVAMVYGDDIGLSTSRARRAMEAIQLETGLEDNQVEHEGRGYVHSKDVVSTGFVQFDSSRVEVEVVYDELAVLEENEGLDITRINREAKPTNPFALNLMRITVDGEPEHDPYKSSEDIQRCTDVKLEQADIRFRFDNLKVEPRLNVTAWPNTIRYQDDVSTEVAENAVRFKIYSNYPSFIDHAEVLIYDFDQSTREEPVGRAEVNDNGEAEWAASFETFEAPLRKLKYVLRVYDAEGNYDQTEGLPLWIVDKLEEKDEEVDVEKELLVGYGESHLAVQNIPVNGGTVLVSGDTIPPEHTVWIAGRPIPVNDNGEFVGEEIFNKGLHTVEVAVLDKQGNGELFLRDLEFEKSDWFYVGIADVTAAKDSTNGPAELITNDKTHYDNDLTVDGRIAFYVDGDFGDDWELTASADTNEAPIDELFSNFMDKSPNALFRRIDPDYTFPTFGDDSTVKENAPTSGKFFIKLQRHNDFGMWGNFNIDYLGSDLAQVDRGLYGARGHFETDATTSFGEKVFEIDGFAAEPGTVGGRDEFRGTGGSVYFLRHQDLLQGSDRVRIEVRDKDSGRVIEVKNLTSVLDYDIDYIQGRILLNQPLSPTASDDLLIADSSISGNPVYLVARYEYTPGFSELEDVAVGTRAHYWINDHFKVGLTGNKQDEIGNENTLTGVDLTLRMTPGSWIRTEFASSEGVGNSALNSNDGGFNFDQIPQSLDPTVKANAYQVEASARLGDIIEGSKGTATLYSKQREAGFSGPGQLSLNETSQIGGSLNMFVTESVDMTLKADVTEEEQALETSAYDLNVGYQFDENWRFSGGTRFETREDNSVIVPVTQTEGDRVDLGVKAEYDSRENWSANAFAQGTTSTSGTRDDNNRVGVGGAYRASDSFAVDGSLSHGSAGTGASLGTDYQMTDRTNLYSKYSLENERSNNGVRSRKGNMNTGMRSRVSDSASVYAEESYTHGDVPTGLTHALGVDIAPNDRWTYGASIEAGELTDRRTGAVTELLATGLRLGYSSGNVTYGGAVEYRKDDIASADINNLLVEEERETWLFKNNLKYQLNPDWRLIGKLNHSDSQSSQGEFFDGKFTEAVIGYGYRPILNDRWNTLFKYTYFFNLPTFSQISTTNTATEYSQKSHIVALDTIYDLTERWSVGGKYAHREASVSLDRENPEFFDSAADLYILRADWHFVHRWDFTIEGRLLSLPDAQDERSGSLISVSRHVGKNLKFGIGYNFTDFSDDLTDLDFDSQGFFINLVGKI